MSVVAPTRLVSSASIDTRLSEATLLLQEFPGSEVPSRAQACVKAELGLPSWARGRGGPRSDRARQGAGWSRVLLPPEALHWPLAVEVALQGSDVACAQRRNRSDKESCRFRVTLGHLQLTHNAVGNL